MNRNYRSKLDEACALAGNLAASLRRGASLRAAVQELVAPIGRGQSLHSPNLSLQEVLRLLRARSHGDELATLGVTLEAVQLCGTDPTGTLEQLAATWRARSSAQSRRRAECHG